MNGFSFGQPAQAKPKETDPILARLNKIRDSYDKDSESYRFKFPFYTRLPNQQQGISQMQNKPPKCVTTEDWEQWKASSPNPDKFQVTVIQGFDALEQRMESQASTINRMKERLKCMAISISNLNYEFKAEIQPILVELNEKNSQINSELMKYMEKKEVATLQSRPFSSGERDISEKLEKFKNEDLAKYKTSLNTLCHNVDLMRDNQEPEVPLSVPENFLSQDMLQILANHTQSVESLGKVIDGYSKNIARISDTLNSS